MIYGDKFFDDLRTKKQFGYEGIKSYIIIIIITYIFWFNLLNQFQILKKLYLIYK